MMLRQPISPIAPFFRVPRKVDRARDRAPRRLILSHSNQIQYRNRQTHRRLDESIIDSIHACESRSPEGNDIGESNASWPAEEAAFLSATVLSCMTTSFLRLLFKVRQSTARDVRPSPMYIRGCPNRAACDLREGLFVSQRDHWIGAHGFAGRQQAGEECAESEERGGREQTT